MSAQILSALENVEAKFQSFSTEQTELRDRLNQLEQKGTANNGERLTKSETLGDKFLKAFTENRELLEKTRSVRLEIKAAGDPVTTASGRTIISGGVGSSGIINQVGMHNALVQRPAPGTSAVEYSRFTGVTGSSAQQVAQGDVKAKLRPEHTLVTQTALTIAGITSLSRQALSDSAELKACIDTVLRDDVQRQLSAAMGTGATGFTGGFNTLSTAFTSVLYTSLVDAVSECVSNMQSAGFQPDTCVISPESWLAIVTQKAADGHYLTGNGMYLASLPTEMRGLRLVLSSTVPTGKALVMDSRHSEMLVVDNFTIEVAYNANDFERNLVSVLGELRVIPIYRSVGSAKLITPKP